MFNIVLVEPEIPQNAGNVIRTCAATGCLLHLVKPLGFSLEDKQYKRAGLDYFDKANLLVYDSLDDLFLKNKQRNFFFASTKSKNLYTNVQYRPGDFFVFGKESAGLPEPLLEKRQEQTVRIPMLSEIRSLNLSNSVAIVLYEALRQQDFQGFLTEGFLTGRGY